ALARWQEVYSVTSFFAGAADDIGYYEMRSVIDAVYGKGAAVTDLVGDDTRWQQVMQLNKDLPAPQINSVPGWASDSDEEHDAAQKGFRFMGQRFSVDEACFTQLIYRQVKEDPDRPEDEQKRMLPDMLDVPAAFGSDTALDILTQQGSTDYPNFDEQMTKVRDTVTNAPSDTWESSLYSAWLHTLSPILDVKDESYPPFMRTDAWRRKSLMSFGGSYTELKHDTILYSKQVMGEMGGGELEEYDDRGYVEPEPLVYSRLQKLVAATSSGLDGFGMLSEKDKEELGILSELAGRLQTIARKELTGELPTDDEFELIRTYGGQLEHFWLNIMDERYPDEDWHSTQEHPAAIVADIATDPNGRCLEVGTGSPMTIYVLVEVDGQLKLATGVTYSFYEFTQPVSERLTDKEWRRKIGIDRSNDAGEYTGDEQIDKSITYPWWYSDLVFGERY
ncbi:MAG: DUF3160 domain-containing protein, partial [Oscillospiraceae bacterium]|nr:DUF3160 domain-containing protein [Oscillospiraceae bacterium]